MRVCNDEYSTALRCDVISILKRLPQPPQTKSGWDPVLKHVFIGHSSCVPNVLLVSQNARYFTKHPDFHCQSHGCMPFSCDSHFKIFQYIMYNINLGIKLYKSILYVHVYMYVRLSFTHITSYNTHCRKRYHAKMANIF